MKRRIRSVQALMTVVFLATTVGAGCRELRFTCEVEREAAHEEDLAYIAIAETSYPPEEDVLALAQGDIVHSPEEPLWWYDEYDGFRVPYCLTAGTVEYYTDAIAELRENPGAFGLVFLAAGFSYHASVEHRDVFERGGVQFSNVYVVTMNMHWEAMCGSLCGMFYNKERIVVLTPAGVVLEIYGDGYTPMGDVSSPLFAQVPGVQ